MAKTPSKTPAKAAPQAARHATASPTAANGPWAAESTPAPAGVPTAAPPAPRNRGGAPKGSCNHIRHGLTAGKLPKDAKYIEWQMNSLRRQLEAAVLESKGAVDLVDAASIQTAVKWEWHGALCLRWLRLEGNALKPAERLNFSREIARASAERDKAIAALSLSKESRPPWLALPAPSNGNGQEQEEQPEGANQ